MGENDGDCVLIIFLVVACMKGKKEALCVNRYRRHVSIVNETRGVPTVVAGLLPLWWVATIAPI
jgi:hypothetical protein